MPERPLFDISRTISERTALFPGDTVFSRRSVMSQADGCSCNVATFTLSAHCGTHADAPRHFASAAPAIDGIDLSRYVGPCRVVHCRHEERVTLDDLAGLDLRTSERLLFRTRRYIPDHEWRDDFAYLGVDVAKACAGAGIKLVGIDTQSVDPRTSKTLDAHHALLSGGVAILENLDLSKIPEGRYELIALPLKIEGADAAPCRAVLRPL